MYLELLRFQEQQCLGPEAAEKSDKTARVPNVPLAWEPESAKLLVIFTALVFKVERLGLGLVAVQFFSVCLLSAGIGGRCNSKVRDFKT